MRGVLLLQSNSKTEVVHLYDNEVGRGQIWENKAQQYDKLLKIYLKNKLLEFEYLY